MVASAKPRHSARQGRSTDSPSRRSGGDLSHAPALAHGFTVIRRRWCFHCPAHPRREGEGRDDVRPGPLTACMKHWIYPLPQQGSLEPRQHRQDDRKCWRRCPIVHNRRDDASRAFHRRTLRIKRISVHMKRCETFSVSVGSPNDGSYECISPSRAFAALRICCCLRMAFSRAFCSKAFRSL